MGIRDHRIAGITIADLLAAILGTVIIFLICWKKWFPNLDPIRFVLAGILLAVPIGITFHILFGINTHLNKKLGLSN